MDHPATSLLTSHRIRDPFTPKRDLLSLHSPPSQMLFIVQFIVGLIVLLIVLFIVQSTNCELWENCPNDEKDCLCAVHRFSHGTCIFSREKLISLQLIFLQHRWSFSLDFFQEKNLLSLQSETGGHCAQTFNWAPKTRPSAWRGECAIESSH